MKKIKKSDLRKRLSVSCEGITLYPCNIEIKGKVTFLKLDKSN